MRPVPPCFSRKAFAVSAVAALGVSVLAACTSTSSSGGSPTPSGSSRATITIGASLSLAGDFSADGKAFEKGYQLWAKDVNGHGGLLGRQVKLTILNDGSSPSQVVTNYQTLLGADHVDLTFGPFSSLLTGPALSVAARYGMAFVEGAGGAPSVFDTPSNQADHNVFDVSLPIADELVPFVTLDRLAAAGPAAEDRGLPDGPGPVRRPAGATRPDVAERARGQDGLLRAAFH